MNLFSIFLKGGFIMWPILLCSIIGVTIIIDRYIVLRRSKINVPAFMVRIRGQLKRRDIAGAISYCMEDKSPVANIIRKGLKKYTLGHERVKEAIENAGTQEIGKLEKGLSFLATIAGIAPLIGFLGTVTGMITAFMTIQDLAGAANPSDLAGGIWEALLTTVAGLIVAIPTFVAYNYLVNRINSFILEMEKAATELVNFLSE